MMGKHGLCIVLEILSLCVILKDSRGQVHEVRYIDLGPVSDTEAATGAVASTPALRPQWDGLTQSARQKALDKLERVNMILTGYRSGLPELTRDDEPWPPFVAGHNRTQLASLMATELTYEHHASREFRLRVERGEIQGRPVSRSTVLDWIRKWETDGLWGLVDKKAARGKQGFDQLDDRFKEAAKVEIAPFDGDISAVSHEELIRRIELRLLRAGHDDVVVSERAKSAYVSWLMSGRGKTPRAQRQRAISEASGTTHAPVMRPGQVVAIDVTRADVRVYCDGFGIVQSVEIITAIDVSTRVVLALRVIPMSADALDAGLLLYDVMRPFSQLVEGSTVHDWRWAGLPRHVEFNVQELGTSDRKPLLPPGPGLQGEYPIPGLKPVAVRCDHGTIFLSEYFFDLLERFGIDLLPSRGSKPTDNSFIERWHETLQAPLQGCPGYKGRNTTERGRRVDTASGKPEKGLLTAAQLQTRLRRWVALEYHNTPHEGLELGKPEGVNLTPLEAFDVYLEMTGRLDVPQHPNLLYQFLPIKWGVIGPSGVEFRNMTYDAEALKEYRHAYVGQFRGQDRAAPFFYDPHDVSCVWFADPVTGAVHRIPWRGEALLEAPMTEAVLKNVQKRIRDREGPKALRRKDARKQIRDALGDLAQEDPRRMGAASLRVDASQVAHAEAQQAAEGGADNTLIEWMSGVEEDTPMPPTVFNPRLDPWPDLSRGGED
ncbi:hypothetical protein LQU92_04155 [Kocuria sp. LUK]|nr:hypothetical protein [Kocuria sp. LUK]